MCATVIGALPLPDRFPFLPIARLLGKKRTLIETLSFESFSSSLPLPLSLFPLSAHSLSCSSCYNCFDIKSCFLVWWGLLLFGLGNHAGTTERRQLQKSRFLSLSRAHTRSHSPTPSHTRTHTHQLIVRAAVLKTGKSGHGWNNKTHFPTTTWSSRRSTSTSTTWRQSEARGPKKWGGEGETKPTDKRKRQLESCNKRTGRQIIKKSEN